MPSDETVGHSHGYSFPSDNESMRNFLASDLLKNREKAFLQIMAALEHGLTPASARLLHKRFKHLAGE